jgi:hypothetical protein
MADIQHYIIEVDDDPPGGKYPRCEAWTHELDSEMLPAEHSEWAETAFKTNCIECLKQVIMDMLQRHIVLDEQLKYYKSEYERLMNGLRDIQQHMKRI